MASTLLMAALALDQLERIDNALETLNSAIDQAGKLDDPLVHVAAKSAYSVCNHAGLHFDEWDLIGRLLGVDNLC